jgi:hypothetical protein
MRFYTFEVKRQPRLWLGYFHLRCASIAVERGNE